MPRQQHDREDLFVEATALVERAELSLPSHREPVVIGFRRDGAVSVYFGADPVYQFNARSQLRRAYVDGLLIKADRGRLAHLRREPRGDRVELLRHDRTDDDCDRLLARITSDLAAVRKAIVAGQCRFLRQVPASGDLRSRIQQWLDLVNAPIVIADSPRAR